VCFSKSLRRREMEGRRCTGRIISSDQRIFITDYDYSLAITDNDYSLVITDNDYTRRIYSGNGSGFALRTLLRL
jgi:hypothetical protein